MKAHHWIILVVAIVIIGGLALWPRLNPQAPPTDELVGTWQSGGTNTDGFDWTMEYVFDNGRYTLTTGTAYGEEGTYRILERFLDDSIAVEKTYMDGERVYEMVLLMNETADQFTLEGVEFQRIK